MGKSSPVLTNTHIFLTANRDTTPFVICLDKRTGEPLWERAVQTQRKETRHPTNALSAPTQATDGENIYSFFTDIGLISHDPSGRPRWEAPIRPTTSIWGVAASPIGTAPLAHRHSAHLLPNWIAARPARIMSADKPACQSIVREAHRVSSRTRNQCQSRSSRRAHFFE